MESLIPSPTATPPRSKATTSPAQQPDGPSRDQEQEQEQQSPQPPLLKRRPIWGERGEDTCAPKREVLADKVPDHTDAPWYVRMWIAAYMRYRGLDDKLAERVHYTGVELQALDARAMVDLFVAKCGLRGSEGEILGRDVWELVQVSGLSGC